MIIIDQISFGWWVSEERLWVVSFSKKTLGGEFLKIDFVLKLYGDSAETNLVFLKHFKKSVLNFLYRFFFVSTT